VSRPPAEKPLVVNRCTVWFDEFDKLGVLHNARYAIHVERAVSLFFASVQSAADPADLHFLVRQYAIEFVRPFTRELGELTVELWMERLGATSAMFGFRCQSETGAAGASSAEVEHARGTRTVVRVDPATGRPAPWSDAFRELFPEEG
jgi:acyl-CoA thioester hydrolase